MTLPIEPSESIRQDDILKFSDLGAALPALSRFLGSESGPRWFEYESPSPEPTRNCLCWYDYQTVFGTLRASLRYSLLHLAYGQPLSLPKVLVLRAFGARISRWVYLSPQVFVDPLFPSLLSIGEGSLLGLGVRIALHEHSGRRFRLGRVRIGRRATIGADARIACGVEIGDEAQIGLGAVVLRDVPAGALAIGNPARIIRRSALS